MGKYFKEGKIKKVLTNEYLFAFGRGEGEIALGFCKAYVQMIREVLCKNLRSPLKKRSTGAFFSLRSTPLFKSVLKKKKTTCSGFFLFWWRRGESNPCPKTYSHIFLRVQFVFFISALYCRQTGPILRIVLLHDHYKRKFMIHEYRCLTPYPKSRWSSVRRAALRQRVLRFR